MDISTFSKNNFTPKKWLKIVFEDRNCEIEIEEFLQSLINELQLYIEQVNSVLEENCHRIANNLPKIIGEVEILNENVMVLSEKLKIIKLEIETIEKNTDESVISLEKIDCLKSTLENVKQTLHEADNWSTLAADIEEYFDNGNIEKITSLLVSMQQSLNVLSNADDYEDKKMQLEGLKNRLEASISPHIVKAFTTSNLDEAVKYVKIFNKIERLPQLLKYYIKCQKGSLCQYWKSIIDSDQDLNLVEQLRSFYDMLLINWQKQIKWCDEVFQSINMVDMVIELYADVLIDLDPSLACCIDTSLKQCSQPLMLLLELHYISSQFQQNLESLHVFNNERQLLDNYLWDYYLKMDSHVDLVDCIHSIGLTIPIVMNIVTEAQNRCIHFTRGCAINGLITALKGYFLKYIDKYKEVCSRLSQLTCNKENWQLLKSCLSFQQIIGELLNKIKKFEYQLLKILKTQKNDNTIEHYSLLILNTVAQREYEDLLNYISDESNASLFYNVINVIEKLSFELHLITYHISFKPISFYLENAKEAWEQINNDTRDLPDYSYSPLEYITQIGEHLITLPQHLEPFLSQENTALNSVLQIINKETKNIPTEKRTYADILLTLVACGTCQAYGDQILNIRELNKSAIRQLAVDIHYFGNVLEELGMRLTENLQHILSLLCLTSDEYQLKSIGFPPKLVAAIRQIRKIPSM
ncbi:hypothetical protein PGB90_004174 [Kerria lacca]